METYQVELSSEDLEVIRAAAGEVSAQGAKDTFCELWPSAKKGLGLLADLVLAIPAAGLKASIAIKAAIAVGDVVASVFCGK